MQSTALLHPTWLLILGCFVASTAEILVTQASAHAQSAEAIATIGQKITVQIEGSTQGSGTLIKKDGNYYTVLTAWHVLESHKPGEELDIYTHDGRRHLLEQGSVRRLGSVDLAVMRFSSKDIYNTALLGNAVEAKAGSMIFVFGFPLATAAMPTRALRLKEGRVEANARIYVPDGYQLLYSNPTLPGMSGGPVIAANGRVVGIHGRGETDAEMSEQNGIAVKTGTNLAVPISYYIQSANGAPEGDLPKIAETADDYIALGESIGSSYTVMEGVSRDESSLLRVIALAEGAITMEPRNAAGHRLKAKALMELGRHESSIEAADNAILSDPDNKKSYQVRGNAKLALKDNRGAITDFDKAISIDHQYSKSYNSRGVAKSNMGRLQEAIADYTIAIGINNDSLAYINRGNARRKMGQLQDSIRDFDSAISVDPTNPAAFYGRAISRDAAGDKEGAISDYGEAINLNPRYTFAYINRGLLYDKQRDPARACIDWRAASSLGDADAAKWVRKDCL